MFLKQITLRNFRVHRNLTLNFTPGVTAIVGQNGKGKSSVFKAIEFLLTGYTTLSKAECITLGEAEGWVSGIIEVNGKEGYIERHLGVSKVVLKYDGKSYNKATEVNELWASLMQIDTAIFHNVVVAGQGVIPLLFSGDQSIREKIFQKIFMVPPTEKLRTIIWDGYIKSAPPELAVEDLSLLESELNEATSKFEQLESAVSSQQVTCLDAKTQSQLDRRQLFLNNCLKDKAYRPSLESQIASIRSEQTALEEKTDALVSLILPSQEYAKLVNLQSSLQQKQAVFNQFTLAKQRYEQLTSTYSKFPLLSSLLASCAPIEKEIEERTTLRIGGTAEVTQLKAEMDNLSSADKPSVCPTCGQKICNDAEAQMKEQAKLRKVDISGLLIKKQAEVNKLTTELRKLTTDLNTLRTECDYARSREATLQEVQNTLSSFGTTAPVDISSELFDVTSKLQAHNSNSAQVTQLKNKSLALQQNVFALETKLQKLSCYDGETSIEEELSVINDALELNRERQQALTDLQRQRDHQSWAITSIKQRMVTSQGNTLANQKRKEYVNTLQGIYDVFSASAFPRQLISSYASYVERFLQINLGYFSIPYKAKIADGFKIQMLDENDRVLPDLSGGQEVIVGLCLRLALHKLFAQSFPMWLVDEGTTHLDERNRSLYFQLIAQLKQEATFKQLLIIDHNSDLATVVDNTITIGE